MKPFKIVLYSSLRHGVIGMQYGKVQVEERFGTKKVIIFYWLNYVKYIYWI